MLITPVSSLSDGVSLTHYYDVVGIAQCTRLSAGISYDYVFFSFIYIDYGYRQNIWEKDRGLDSQYMEI